MLERSWLFHHEANTLLQASCSKGEESEYPYPDINEGWEGIRDTTKALRGCVISSIWRDSTHSSVGSQTQPGQPHETESHLGREWHPGSLIGKPVISIPFETTEVLQFPENTEYWILTTAEKIPDLSSTFFVNPVCTKLATISTGGNSLNYTIYVQYRSNTMGEWVLYIRISRLIHEKVCTIL